jgi:large subunit ribosomal protein L25
MATVNLSVDTRASVGKGAARKMRSAGSIPAVVYGHAREPQALTVNNHELTKLLDKVSYKTTVIELQFTGGTSAKTLIREIQRHPFKRHILHVDFQELVAGEKVTVKVPLVFVGTPDGVRLGGGILDEVMRELEVAVDPSNIPNHIDVDVTKLQVGHSIHVRDLIVPANVEVMNDADQTVALCTIPKAAAEPTPEEAAAAAAAGEPELIRKAKADADAAEAAAAEKK